jgi:hypothetical protein
MEIVAALQRKIRVIPVLVGGARMPGRHDLPEALAPLSRRNAIELSETRFHADVSRLIEAIEKFFAVTETSVELSATPATPPAEPAAVRALEPEPKDLPKSSESMKAAEAKETKEIDADAVSGAAPVSPGETRKQFPTQAAPPHWEPERSQRDSVATANDLTTPVKLTQRTRATPLPVPSTSSIAALKEPEVWTWQRTALYCGRALVRFLFLDMRWSPDQRTFFTSKRGRLILSGAVVFLLLALAGVLVRFFVR